MPKFINTLERIAGELGLVCDGTFENALTAVKSTPASNTTSGKAILQMLQKGESTPSRDLPVRLEPSSSKPETTSSIVDLLRQEFASPQIVPPPPPPAQQPRPMTPQIMGGPYMQPPPVGHAPHHMLPMGGPPPHSLFDSSCRQFPPNQPMHHHNPMGMPPSDSITISRNDLRTILADMVGSDQFVNELFQRLASRNRF